MRGEKLSRREIKDKLQEIQSIVMNDNIITNSDRFTVMNNTVAIWRSLFGSASMKPKVFVPKAQKGKVGKAIESIKKRSLSLT